MQIRNFAIIAHIDHGKSTLADRLLETTNTIAERDYSDRVLDTLELEQERGITIKLQTARMVYKDHILNLIDTPGHVDFSYEVARSLRAAEGALLLVDASQGIQAQTLTTVYKAIENDLEIIPVINKIDLPIADVKKTMAELIANFGFREDEIILASAKSGIGVTEILDAIIKRVPAPKKPEDDVTRAYIFDSFYHEHKGVVALVKIVSGEIKKDQEVYSINSDLKFTPIEIGYLKPKLTAGNSILTGEVGYIATGLKDIRMVHAGDTITLYSTAEIEALPGYQAPKPMVFASIYPVVADEFPELQESIGKLALTDAALTFKKESNQALGSGFNCGFLGLLHLEISQERLEREFNLDLISTTPSVEYKVKLSTKDFSKIPNLNIANIDEEGLLHVHSSAEFPDPTLIDQVYEPWVKLEIVTPDQYIGEIMDLVTKHRGEYTSMEYTTHQTTTTGRHVILRYDIPSAEIMTDFFDKLKSISQGYASMDYEFSQYRLSDVVKVSILVNAVEVEALSFISHRSSAEHRAKKMVSKLVDIIPKQNFKVPIQGAIGGKIIARETIQAFRKDVTAKLYGGDITRKMKLLNKQKKGKKRMKEFGSVQIPKEAFLAALGT